MARQVFGEFGYPMGGGSGGGAGGGSFVTTPVVTGPAEALSGKAVQLTAQAVSLINGGAIAWFEITDSLGNDTRAEATNNAAAFNVSVYGALGDVNTISVRAVDNLGNSSAAAQKAVTITDNSVPDMSAFTHTVPESINQQATAQVRFSGATDPDGDAFTYTITPGDSGLTFSKLADIAENEEITLTAPPQVMPLRPVSFGVSAVDAKGGKASTSIGISIIGNRAPSMGGFTHTVPATVVQGSTTPVRFSGATDPDGDALTYTITPGDNGLTFSKLSGIAPNESVNMTAPGSVAASLPVAFTVTADDGRGGTATASVATSILGQDTWTITATQNWAPPVGGTYEIDVHGGNGGGCDSASHGGYASGAAGGRAVLTTRLEKGVQYAVTVGANGGGNRRADFTVGCGDEFHNRCGSSIAAGAGGTSSFGPLVSATGGGGGVCGVAADACTVGDEYGSPGKQCRWFSVSGSPGNGYGGTQNFTGGSSGPKCIVRYRGA